MNSIVPYVPVSQKRKNELASLFKEANAIVHEFATKTGQSPDEVRSRIVSGKMEIPKHSFDKVIAARDSEWEALCAFSNLISKIVNKWASKSRDLSLSAEDLMSEAHSRTVKSLRAFNQEGIQLSTFIHVCVNRRLSQLCVRSSPVSRLSSSMAELRMKYFSLASEEGATFDGIVHKMGISEKQVGDLVFVLKGVVNEADSEDSECFTMRLVDESAGIPEDDSEEKMKIMSVVKNLEMSELERAVLEGFMSSEGRMGLGSVSKNLINPKTNKPYSRMSFSFAWERVKKKILDAYSEVA